MKTFIVLMMLFILPVASAFAGTNQQISGLVIDSRGYELLNDSPLQILDTRGLIINSLVTYTPFWMLNNHSISYYKETDLNNIAEGNSRVGSNFLMIKVIATKNMGRSLIISNEDADQILKYREMKDIFERGNIIILN